MFRKMKFLQEKMPSSDHKNWTKKKMRKEGIRNTDR